MSKILKYIYIFLGILTLVNVVEVAFFHKPMNLLGYCLGVSFLGIYMISEGLKHYSIERSQLRLNNLVESIKNTKDPNITEQEKEELVQYIEALNKHIK